MAREIIGTLPYLMAVMNRFGSEREKYAEFFRIFSNFKKKVDGDEIIRRSKELFDGDEIMVMGFYRLLLEQKRKKKRPDDFGDTLIIVCQLMGLLSLKEDKNSVLPTKLFFKNMFKPRPPIAMAYMVTWSFTSQSSHQNNEDSPKSFSEILYMVQKNDSTLDAPPEVIILEPQEATIPYHEQADHEQAAHKMLVLKKFSILPGHVQKMGENKRSHPNDIDGNTDCTDSENGKRRCVEKDSRDDSRSNDHAKIPENDSRKLDNMHHKQKNPQRVGSSDSSKDRENNMTGFFGTGGHIASSDNAEGRETFMEDIIDDGQKARDIKHRKNKEKIRLGKQHSPDSNKETCQRASLSTNGKEYTKLVSELDLSGCQSCTPNYQLQPEEMQVPLVRQKMEPDASVLNDRCVSVNTKVYSSKAKSNPYEDILFKCEDDMFELDMLLATLKATIKNVKKIIAKMSDKNTHPDFQFQIERYLTSSNLRCIVQMYDTNWPDILDSIHQNAKMMGIILYRLEQREKELETFRLDFHKVCRDVFAENCPKLYNR